MANDNEAVQTTVTQLYIALFGRAPDPEGLAFWVQRLQEGQSVKSVANTMLATAPGQEMYPESMSSVEVVVALYRNVLGREPDPAGLIYWSNRLDNGSEGLGGLVSELIEVVVNYVPDGQSSLGLDGQHSRDLFLNRVQFGKYLATLDLTPEEAAELMAQVSDSPESVEQAMALADALAPPPAPAPAPAPSPDPDPSSGQLPDTPVATPPPPPPPPPPPAPSYIEHISGPGSDQITLTLSEEHVLISVGVAAHDAEAVVDFGDLGVGQSVEVDGLKLTATQPMLAVDVAAAFDTRTTLAGTFSGPSNFTDWSVKPGSLDGISLTFTSSTAPGDLPLVTAGRTETVTVTFKALDPGQSVTVDGMTLLALTTMSAVEVALAFKEGDAAGKGSFDPDTMPHWSVLADSLQGDELTFQSLQANADVGPMAVSAQGRTEEVDISFTSLLPGQSLTLGAAVLTALYDMSAANVAAAFNGQLDTNLGTMSGAVGDWTVKAGYVPGDTQLTFVSTDPNTNVTDLQIAVAGATEQTGVVLEGLSAGQSVTIAGKTLLATDTMTAQEVTADFFNITNGSGSKSLVTGSLTDWYFAGVGGDYLLFESVDAQADVDPLPVVMAGRNESATITFGDLLAGQGITVAGWSLEALVDLDADEVASLFAGADADGLATLSDGLEGWTLQAGYTSGNQLVFVSTTTEADVTDISVVPFSTAVGVVAPDPLVVDTTAFALTPAVFQSEPLVQGVAPPPVPGVVLRNGATLPSVPDLVVTDGLGAPDDPIYLLTIPLAIHADSASPAMPGEFDILTDFDLALDRLDFPYGFAMFGSFDDTQTGVTGLGIADILDGVATFDGALASTATLEERVQAVLTAMGTATVACAFVMDDGQGGFDSFVVYGDGAAGVQATDTLVQLSGVAITDLYAIMI